MLRRWQSARRPPHRASCCICAEAASREAASDGTCVLGTERCSSVVIGLGSVSAPRFASFRIGFCH